MSLFDSWNLIKSGCCSGEINMAFDFMLFEKLKAGVGKPTLRFFQWERPTISYGLNQKNIEKIVDFEKCSRLGIELVRRPTGGRELLHGYDLSYSVVDFVSNKEGSSGSIKGVCAGIHRAVIDGLIAYGLDADGFNDNHLPDRGYSLKDIKPCFTSVTGNEITYRGKKMVGSSQRRERDVYLQHGSIQIVYGTPNIIDLLNIIEDKERNRIKKRMMNSVTSIEEILADSSCKKKLDITKLEDCITESFSGRFNIDFKVCGQPEFEKETAIISK